MYCVNCGANLQDGSKFCHNCGCINNEVLQREMIIERTREENPYVAVSDVPQPQQNENAQLYPQAPAPQPQYFRTVNTPTGTQYIPVEPVTSFTKPQEPPKHSAFTFISAGIMGTMILMFFMPWINVSGEGYSLLAIFTELSFLENYGADIFIGCSVFMLVGLGMLIPGLILALTKRNRMPIGFAIAASVITFIVLFFFLILMTEVSYRVTATAVPAFMFILAIANIVFAVLARKK